MSCLSSHFDRLFLLIEVFSIFTFNLIFDVIKFKFVILIFSYLPYQVFSFLFFLTFLFQKKPRLYLCNIKILQIILFVLGARRWWRSCEPVCAF